MGPIPKDPVAEIFPFIAKPTLTWPEFLLTPSLWFAFLSSVGPIDRTKFPEPVQELFAWGEGKGKSQAIQKASTTIDVSPTETDYYRSPTETDNYR